jgi:pimeloyl-ACP methyl ester carboxylesterase
VGSSTHRASLGHADEAPGVHEIRGSRRRLGCGHHRTNGCAGGSGIARHSHIADSPVGLAAYFLDHDAWSYALISRVFAGGSEGLTRDDILDNVTITWLTNTAISGARLYWESKLPYFSVKGVSVPVAVSAFPDEIDLCPRSWAERAYPKLIHYNKVEKGGHFAAWEQPKLFSEEVRAGFRPLRKQ